MALRGRGQEAKRKTEVRGGGAGWLLLSCSFPIQDVGNWSTI